MKSYYLLIIFIMSILSACSSHDGPEDYTYNPEDYFSVSFKMVTSGRLAGTRADAAEHDETESEYREFEDGFDINDLGIFVFVRKQDSEDNQKYTEELLLKSTDLLAPPDSTISISGSPGTYVVNMNMSKSKLGTLLGREFTPDGSEDITFRILILANCASSKEAWAQITGETYTDVIGQLENWTFSMSDLYNKDGGETAAALYGKGKKNIPMFGSNTFTANQQALYYSRYETPVFFGEIDMLRSLAKVRVVDNIDKRANGYPKIVGAEFIGSQDMAYQLPFDAVNYRNGNQVHSARVAEPGNHVTNHSDRIFKLGTIPASWMNDGLDNGTGNVRIGYVPEQSIINTSIGDAAVPEIKVSVAFKEGDGPEFIQDYIVPMKEYNGQSFNFGDFILRNHIYTLEVNQVSEIEFKISVDPWTPEYIEFDFTQNIGMAQDGALTFVEGTYAGLNPATGRLVLNNYPDAVSGSFGFSTPIGARWYAYLVTRSGELDVIRFITQDEDGNPTTSSYLTGIIDGKKVNFQVAATQSAGTELRSAVLQVVVQVYDGLTIPVNVLKSTEYGEGVENIIFIQNPK